MSDLCICNAESLETLPVFFICEFLSAWMATEPDADEEPDDKTI
jgi:hypothetical protein